MDGNLVLFGVAMMNAFTAYMAYKTHTLTKQVEVATNSMKDALVKATGESARLAGKEEGRIEESARAGAVAEGKLKQ